MLYKNKFAKGLFIKSRCSEFNKWKTINQWLKLGCKLKNGAFGILMWSNACCREVYKYYAPCMVEVIDHENKN